MSLRRVPTTLRTVRCHLPRSGRPGRRTRQQNVSIAPVVERAWRHRVAPPGPDRAPRPAPSGVPGVLAGGRQPRHPQRRRAAARPAGSPRWTTTPTTPTPASTGASWRCWRTCPTPSGWAPGCRSTGRTAAEPDLACARRAVARLLTEVRDIGRPRRASFTSIATKDSRRRSSVRSGTKLRSTSSSLSTRCTGRARSGVLEVATAGKRVLRPRSDDCAQMSFGGRAVRRKIWARARYSPTSS